MTTILVTGGAGFIGQHLVQRLVRSGCHVRVIDSLVEQVHGPLKRVPSWLHDPNIEYIQKSINDIRYYRNILDGVHTIVHLASETGTAQSMQEIERYNYANSHGTAVILDQLVNTPENTVEHIILASTRAVYGEGAYHCHRCHNKNRLYPSARTAEQLSRRQWDHYCPTCGGRLDPVASEESDPVRPASIYAATKFEQEMMVKITCKYLGIGYTIFRLQNVYGRGQSMLNPYAGIIPIFSTLILKGDEINLFEQGGPTRDFVHVDDCCRAIMALLSNDKPQNTIINIGSGKRISVREAAVLLSRALNREPKLLSSKEYRLGDIRHNMACIIKMKKLLGVEPEIDFHSGIEDFAEWIKSQPIQQASLN